MEFGKVQDIDNVDFTLPADDPVTLRLWEQRAGVPKQPLKVRVGGTEWGRSSWLGRVYPKGTRSKDFLTFYAKQFNAVEGHTLYYGLQAPATIEFVSKGLHSLDYSRADARAERLAAWAARGGDAVVVLTR